MKLLLALAATAAILFLSPVATAQESEGRDAVGKKAPLFKLIDSKGNEVDLAKVVGKKPIVLVFYRGNW